VPGCRGRVGNAWGSPAFSKYPKPKASCKGVYFWNPGGPFWHRRGVFAETIEPERPPRYRVRGVRQSNKAAQAANTLPDVSVQISLRPVTPDFSFLVEDRKFGGSGRAEVEMGAAGLRPSSQSIQSGSPLTNSFVSAPHFLHAAIPNFYDSSTGNQRVIHLLSKMFGSQLSQWMLFEVDFHHLLRCGLSGGMDRDASIYSPVKFQTEQFTFGGKAVCALFRT
jgi:hypothetical protein